MAESERVLSIDEMVDHLLDGPIVSLVAKILPNQDKLNDGQLKIECKGQSESFQGYVDLHAIIFEYDGEIYTRSNMNSPRGDLSLSTKDGIYRNLSHFKTAELNLARLEESYRQNHPVRVGFNDIKSAVVPKIVDSYRSAVDAIGNVDYRWTERSPEYRRVVSADLLYLKGRAIEFYEQKIKPLLLKIRDKLS